MKFIEKAIASIAPQDETALKDVENMITVHALGASSAAVASGVLPGVGEAIAISIALAFTCSMYYRIAKRMGLNMRRNVLKAIASVVIAEIAIAVVGVLAVSTVLSFIPGIGTGGAMLLAGLANFMMVEAAGKMFLLILSKLFRAKTLADIEAMSEEELRAFAKGCSTKSVVKEAVKDAKENYRHVKDNAQLKQQAASIKPDEDVLKEARA